VPEAQLEQLDKEIFDLVAKTKLNVENAFERGSLRGALEHAMSLCTAANAYLQQREPWKNEILRPNTLFVCACVSKALAILLYPFIPSVSKKLWKMLNMKGKISWKDLDKECKPGHKINEPEILLEKVDIEKIKGEYEKFRRQREVSEPAGGSDRG
jgi:methionyl-tRNA synthetase